MLNLCLLVPGQRPWALAAEALVLGGVLLTPTVATIAGLLTAVWEAWVMLVEI